MSLQLVLLSSHSHQLWSPEQRDAGEWVLNRTNWDNWCNLYNTQYFTWWPVLYKVQSTFDEGLYSIVSDVLMMVFTTSADRSYRTHTHTDIQYTFSIHNMYADVHMYTYIHYIQLYTCTLHFKLSQWVNIIIMHSSIMCTCTCTCTCMYLLRILDAMQRGTETGKWNHKWHVPKAKQ